MNFLKIFSKPASAGETEVTVSDTPNTANPPAASGGAPTEAAIQKIVQQALADVLPKALGDAIKPISERLVETEKNVKTVADTVANQKILGEDGVKALIAADAQARTAAAQKEADAKQAAEAIKTKREAFAKEHLKNVPARYHAELGDDEAKWAETAKTVRDAFAADMKAAGVKVPDVGGDTGGGAVEGKPKEGGFLKMPGAAASA